MIFYHSFCIESIISSVNTVGSNSGSPASVAGWKTQFFLWLIESEGFHPFSASYLTIDSGYKVDALKCNKGQLAIFSLHYLALG